MWKKRSREYRSRGRASAETRAGAGRRLHPCGSSSPVNSLTQTKPARRPAIYVEAVLDHLWQTSKPRSGASIQGNSSSLSRKQRRHSVAELLEFLAASTRTLCSRGRRDWTDLLTRNCQTGVFCQQKIAQLEFFVNKKLPTYNFC